MSSEGLWENMIKELSFSEVELQTTTGLWFRASSQNNRLYIDKATENTPSSELSIQRTISKNDFIFVYSYYDRWIKGESGVRHAVSRRSRNTAYIFSLIEKYRK